MSMILMCLLSQIYATLIVEYRLWYNFGQVINDYSGNGLHAVYGTSYSDTVNDPVPTPKGAYFYTGNTITIPQNDLIPVGMRLFNPFSLVFWMFNPSSNSGMFFYRYGVTDSSEYIQCSIANTNQVSVAIQQTSLSDSHTFQTLLNNNIWNLIVISFSGSKINLNINTFDTETYSVNTFIQEDSSQTYGTNIMNPQFGMNQTYIFSLVITDTEAASTNYYNTQDINACVVRACNQYCSFAAVTSLGNGCISTLLSPYLGLGGADWFSLCGISLGADSGICYNCSSSCSPNTCTFKYSQVLCERLSQTNCSFGYYLLNNACLMCNSDCFDCENSSMCSTCKDYKALPGAFGCNCISGYYNTSSLANNGSCLQCNSDCLNCTNSSTCSTCKDSHASPKALGCECISGYYNTSSLTENGSCLSCTWDCSICTNSSTCLLCKDSHALIGTLGCNCISGYYNTSSLTENGSCLSCSSDCYNCTNFSMCSFCKDFYALPEVFGCKCISGYYNTSSLVNNGTCLQCNSDCFDCTNSSTCLICKDSHALPATFGCKCMSGFYNTSTLTDNGSCLSCSSDCSFCTNSSTCSICKDSHALPGLLGCNCISGYYNTSTLTSGGSCLKCDSNCFSCTDLNECKNNSFYWDGTACFPCESSCLSCDGPTNCLSNTKSQCENGYYSRSETCGGVTTDHCFICDSTCFTCSGPYRNQCSSCHQNATLQSNQTCICNKGFSWDSLCTRNKFSAFMSINSTNFITITFSEALVTSLNSTYFEIKVWNESQNFKILIIDNLTILIQILFLKDVEKNTGLEVFILHDVVSQENSLLSTFKFTAVLYPETSEILAQKALRQQIASVKTATYQGAAIGGAVLVSVCLLNFNFGYLFQFLNAAEIYLLIQNFNIDLDPVFLEFLSSLQSSFQVPSIFSFFVSNEAVVSIPTKYQNIGYSTSLIMINSGSNITLFIGISGFLSLLWVIKGFWWLVTKRTIEKINRFLVCRVFIRFWIQTVIDLSINSIVGIYLTKLENNNQIIDFLLSIFFIVNFK